MQVKVKVETLSDLYRVSFASVGALADALGVAQPTVSCKVNGLRTWYEDELDALVSAMNEPGHITVTRDTVVKLIGAREIKVRGSLHDHEKKTGGAK